VGGERIAPECGTAARLDDALGKVAVRVVPTCHTCIEDRVVVDDERVGAGAADELGLRLRHLDLLQGPGADRAGTERLADEEVRRRRVEIFWRRRRLSLGRRGGG